MPGFRKFGRKRGYKRKMPMRSRGKTSLATLEKTVKKLVARDKVQTVKTSFRQSETIDDESMNPYIGKLITSYPAWTLLWPSVNSAAHGVRNQARLKSILIDNLVTLDNGVNTERSSISFTYFVFRPKEAAAAIPTSTTANGTELVPTLSADTDYSMAYGKCYLNLHKYKVLYCRRFTLTQAENTNGDAARIQQRFQVKLRLNNLIKSADDTWKDMVQDDNETNNIYMCLFSDNSIIDGQVPRWEYSLIANVEQ